MASRNLIERYVALKVLVLMEDARSSTSYEEEFEHLLRKGCTPAEEMDDAELLEAIQNCEDSLDENQHPGEEEL